MAPGNRRQDDPWDQPTEVFAPVRGEHAPLPRRGDPGPSKQARTRQRILIGVSAAVVAAVLIVGGLFVTGFFAQTGPSEPNPTAAAQTTTTAAAGTTRALPVPSAGAPIATVAKWIEAGTPVDASGFHSATTEDGKATNLGSAVAFASPSEKIRCMTPRKATTARPGMRCIVQYDDPPARPADAPSRGNWVGSLTDFQDGVLGIGQLAGDPGDFTLGDGATLAYGSRLTFNEFDCRMDEAGLFCLDKNAGAAVRLGSKGAEPFGCLGETASEQYGIEYSCASASDPTTTKPSTTQSSSTTTPAAGGAPALGAPCTESGKKAKSADGRNLTCGTASDGDLRWLGY
ncbi:hypothetical protein AB0C65_38205 [Nocardia sp. NPDC048505]|uniref:hypothetical protein n=1 Tax=Nocardia sp. NPDC048505 TaxID=3155756 RepID=UPI00340EE277